MKFIIVSFFVSIFSIFSSQTADEIIKTHLEKTGGIKNWNDLNSVKINGNAIFGLKEIYKIEIIQKNPNLNKSTLIIGKQRIILEAYDGKNAYRTNFKTGKKEIIKDYIPESFDSDFLNYQNKGFKIELKGTEKINKQECYKIIFTKNNVNTIYYLNTATYYLMKEVKPDETLEYSNYKKVGNLWFAYTIESSSDKKDSDYTLNISSLEINKKMEDKEFSY